MHEETARRLAAIRADLSGSGIHALIVPRSDEYLGEYVPEHNERLRWITGFSGSAGMALILEDRAALFVDGRYTIQVRQQVSADLYEFHHLIEEPPVQWLTEILPKGSSVGIDSRLHSWAFYDAAATTLDKAGITLVELTTNPIDAHWVDRPEPAREPALLLAGEYTGESSQSKRERVADAIREAGADATLITPLDSIAWLLNLRGSDIPHLPVVLGFAILDNQGNLSFFTNPVKIPNDFNRHTGDGVTVLNESRTAAALEELGRKKASVLVDRDVVSAYAVLRCQEAGARIVEAVDPVLMPKACKNETEIEGARKCHLRDGAALSRYLAWLDHEVAAGRFHDEGVLADRLESFRRESPALQDLSFDTISAAGANGALCHYHHKNGTPATLEPGSLYLVDSGGQYLEGTTDITRTVTIGEPTAEHREMFTLVLRGHIALARAVFPAGTTGLHLDVLARQYLWQKGLDYDHGTGHGVGSFLAVHEGPQRIARAAGASAELKPGMILSNEPGYYKEGCYGIRCENLMVVRERDDGMLFFETVSFAPFDLRLIDPALMTRSEIRWLDQYHHEVREKIAPALKGADLDWLMQSTRALSEESP